MDSKIESYGDARVSRARPASALARGVILLSMTVLVPSHAWSKPETKIYSWKDKNGVVHFATQPGDAESKEVELPPINRAEMTGLGKIEPVRSTDTCKGHGDVNCPAGPDKDGSVICTDGFKDALARFNFTCRETKLELSDVSNPQRDGTFSVFIRNLKGVAAKGTEVSYNLAGKDITLIGPDKVDPFGMAEYFYNPRQGGKVTDKPEKTSFRVACHNCQ